MSNQIFAKSSIFGKIALCLLFGSLSVSCNNEIDLPQSVLSNSKPMEIAGIIDQLNETRASDYGFADGDCMGVFIVDRVSGVPGELTLNDNRASNYALSYNAETNNWIGKGEIYWPSGETAVDVYGYYPYESSLASIDDYNFTVEADQSIHNEGEMSNYEASDFLWAKVENATQAAGTINLKYHHRMAGVRVILEEGSGFAANEWKTLSRLVTVDNTLRNATIDLATGVASPIGDFDRHITMSIENNDTYRAVVVPQSVAAGKSIIGVTIDGISYSLTKETDLVYSVGKLHNFIITVNKRAESGDYELKISNEGVSEWINDQNSHFFSQFAYVTVHVEQEGTLEQCLAEKDCDFNNLKNLKVTGNLTDADFEFIRNKLPYLYALNLRETKIKHGKVEHNWETDITTFADDCFPENALYGKRSIRAFIFPKSINRIACNALRETQFINVLVIPNSVKRIDKDAFAYISERNLEIVMPDSLEYIGDGAFGPSEFKCELKMTNTIKHIGSGAFEGAHGMYGHFRLPDNLEYLGGAANDNGEVTYGGVFQEMGHDLTGDIVIPKNITKIPNGAFFNMRFAKGTTLTFHDGVTVVGRDAFRGLQFNQPISFPKSLTTYYYHAFGNCKFQGTLNLPKSVTYIGAGVFGGEGSGAKGFTGELTLPDNISIIGRWAFCGQTFTSVSLSNNITTIDDNAFRRMERVKNIKLGKSVEFIGDGALTSLGSLQTLICLNPTPPKFKKEGPFVFEGNKDFSFDKVILEVPEGSVELYRNTPGWNEFRNITPHKELAYNIPQIECLQTGITRSGLVRSEGAWEVVECPSWCTVSPMQGGENNREEVSITVAPMSQGIGTREGSIVFKLKNNDYITYTDVKQYNYEYAEDSEIVLQDASVAGAKPIPIFIVGEGFDAESIANGSYLELMRQQMEHFFNVEPYRTYRNYFKVMTSIALSPDEGIIMAGEIASENKFNSRIDYYGLHFDEEKVCKYAKEITKEDDLSRLSILILGNMSGSYTKTVHGYNWWDAKHISFCSITEDSYPYDQRGLIQHEFGGHNFANLGDENVEHYEFIKACTCPGCNALNAFYDAKNNGGFNNLSLTSSINTVPWAHLIFDPRYNDIVDLYEGGHRHARGVYRSEIKSCMGAYIPYYNTISRETIVRRIMKLAGLTFDFNEFAVKDSRDGIPEQE